MVAAVERSQPTRTGTNASAKRIRRLRPAEPGLGLDGFEIDGPRPQHLRHVRAQDRQLLLDRLVHVDVERGVEAASRRCLVLQDRRQRPAGREARRGRGAVVLVGVLDRVRIEDVGARSRDRVVDDLDRFGPVGHGSVVVPAPAHLGTEAVGSLELLALSTHALDVAEPAFGHHEDGDLVAPQRVAGQRRPAPELHVVGMRPDRQDVHVPFLPAAAHSPWCSRQAGRVPEAGWGFSTDRASRPSPRAASPRGRPRRR